MKIVVVHGFFLPIPPAAGGAMEKIWWRLAREFAARGHEVVSVSRQWPGWPDAESLEGVRLVRVPGRDHSRRLAVNLVRDAFWSWRVMRRLPAADILVTNNVLLPAIAPHFARHAGRVVANLNRYPKGQVRWWRRIARLQAASGAIAAAARAEAPRLSPRIRVTPNPIDLALFAAGRPPRTPNAPIRLGFVGRIHPEKGLRLLVEIAHRLARMADLPRWEIVLRGPADVARGGGGEAFARSLIESAGPLVDSRQWHHESPEFDPVRLASAYRACDLFVYPTQAEHGEALPVAVLEAMASGLPVVATGLSCFDGYVVPHQTGLTLPLGASADAWAAGIETLLRDAQAREAMGRRARTTVASLDFASQSEAMLADFASLLLCN